MSLLRHRVRHHVVVPIAILVGAMIVLAIVLLTTVAHRQTADALASQRALAESMLTVRLAEIEKLARDYGYWDEAYDELVRAPNREWAAANIGPEMRSSHGIDFSFALDSSRRAIYAQVGGETAETQPSQVLKGGVDALLSAREAAGPDGSVSGILVANGEPVLASVAPLRPFLKDDPDRGSPRHVLLFADRLDEAQLRALAKTFLLPDLRLADPGAASDETSIGIRTFDDQASARLTWDGADPGGDMLRDLLPLVIGVLVAFVVFAALVLRNAERAADRLEASERRASHDLLTGLHNRAALLEQLDPAADQWPAIRRGYALLYIDLDGFKAVNDTHGHGMGDEVLRIAARRLRAAVPAEGRAFRLGGDEFAVVVPGMKAPAEIRQVGTTIVAALSKPLDVAGTAVGIGATVGVAIAPAGGRADIVDVLRQADQALYLGKRTSKGTVRFHVEATDPESLVS